MSETLRLADTSAYTVAARSPEAAKKLTALLRERDMATFVTVDLELGFSARTPNDHQLVFAARGELVQLAMVDEIAERARQVQALMAARSQHRAAGIIDLLTAAAAEYYRVPVLHYDADFDHIAAVTGQASQWILPAGSL